MRTKKLLYMGCLMAASMLTFTSCSDFLDEDPKGQLNPDTFYTIEDDYIAGINTLYDKVNQTQSWTNPMYPQWQGDDITANPGSNKQACAALDAFASDGGNKGVADAWTQHYSVIKTANLIIEGSEKFPGDKTKIAAALGNAHFWRAYSYFYLVRVFGKLPIITKTNIDQFNAAPEEIEKIYELIVKDLKDAINELPTKYENEPSHLFGVDVWTTKQAAQATLSAVYMSMAGYPLNKGTEYYKLAAEQAKAVIDGNGSYGFILNPEWKDVYSMGNNYNMETVLGINNDAKGWWDHDSQLSSCCRFEGLGDGGWGDAWGEIAFWKRFPEGARKDAIYAPKVTFQDNKSKTITKTVDWWALKEDGKPEVEAYHPMFCIFTVNCDEKGNMLRAPYDYLAPNYDGMVNDRRHNLIRYSEILLWYAESAARSGGDLNKAKECLRQVRSRAVNDVENVTLSNGTTVKIADMNAEQLAEACYIEHGWEVAGNWVSMVTRRSDELRMDELKKNFDYRVTNAPLVVAKQDGKTYTAKESVTVSGSWSEDRIYCPYPTSDVEKNPNLKR